MMFKYMKKCESLSLLCWGCSDKGFYILVMLGKNNIFCSKIGDELKFEENIKISLDEIKNTNYSNIDKNNIIEELYDLLSHIRVPMKISLNHQIEIFKRVVVKFKNQDKFAHNMGKWCD